MPWNPEIYNQFKAIRYQPFFDLMELIEDHNHMKMSVDIGCGTGEQTSILAHKFEKANFIGIDSSKEMLKKSKDLEHERLKFELFTIEDFAQSHTHWDLIFSNAALQWSDNHENLFHQLISKLNQGGRIAIQMPCQKDNILNVLLNDLVQEKPFVDYLDGFIRESPVLNIEEYAQLFFENGLTDLKISQRIYPIYATSVDELYNFISGSALIPYMEKLDETQQEELTKEYKSKINYYFKKYPAIYPFKRMLLYGKLK